MAAKQAPSRPWPLPRVDTRAGDDKEYARYHVDETNMADRIVWKKTKVDTSVADGAPPLPSTAKSSPLSVGVRAVALLSACCCLCKKAKQHDAADDETADRELSPNVMNDNEMLPCRSRQEGVCSGCLQPPASHVSSFRSAQLPDSLERMSWSVRRQHIAGTWAS